MKYLLAMILALGIAVASANAAEADWITDVDAAFAEAKQRNVPILADFSGSDWCGWCIKLDNEVFSQPEFQAYAKRHYVLLLVDFPYHKEQPAAQKKQNKALAEKYNIEVFPTVLILDQNGKVLARTGYRHGGAESYIKHLGELQAAK